MGAQTHLSELIERWSRRDDYSDVANLDAQYEFMEANYWNDFEPALNGEESFRVRLENWIRAISPESDQVELFRSLQFVQYFSRQEIEALCVVAHEEHVIPWLVEKDDIQLDSRNVVQELRRAVGQTWFCPVTDSMPIALFHHLNRISGRDHRPDWRSVAMFADPRRMSDYLAKKGIRRLVLLEDFVGSGSQILEAVDFAVTLTPAIDVLALPLICCPTGADALRGASSKYPQLTTRFALEMNRDDFVSPVPLPGERGEMTTLRALAERSAVQVKGDGRKFYSEFGFDDTGALVVLYSNSPDNTLPLFHRRSPAWAPPFPRASRV